MPVECDTFHRYLIPRAGSRSDTRILAPGWNVVGGELRFWPASTVITGAAMPSGEETRTVVDPSTLAGAPELQESESVLVEYEEPAGGQGRIVTSVDLLDV